jgi:hypothetical protein
LIVAVIGLGNVGLIRRSLVGIRGFFKVVHRTIKNKSLKKNQKCRFRIEILFFYDSDLEKKEHASTFATRFPKGITKQTPP